MNTVLQKLDKSYISILGHETDYLTYFGYLWVTGIKDCILSKAYYLRYVLRRVIAKAKQLP